MRKRHLPLDSKRYTEQAFKEKNMWHRRQERMSLTRKLEVLDRLREAAKALPKLERNNGRSRLGKRKTLD